MTDFYSVGPAPPPIRDGQSIWTPTKVTQAQYRDHLNKLNQLLKSEQRLAGEVSKSDYFRMDSFEDLCKDFDSVYESMCHTGASSQATPNESLYGEGSNTSNQQASWSKGATFETKALSESLEEALKEVRSTMEPDSPTSSILAETGAQITQTPSQVSPVCSSKLSVALNEQQHLNNLPQPSLSPMLSTATSEQTRADSRNTNQSYQNGPALVEEMTLSDLEDEISSSLMVAKESSSQSRQYFSDGEQLMLRTRRSRNPLPSSLSRNSNNTLTVSQHQNGTQQALIGYHSIGRRYPRTAQGMYSRARQLQ